MSSPGDFKQLETILYTSSFIAKHVREKVPRQGICMTFPMQFGVTTGISTGQQLHTPRYAYGRGTIVEENHIEIGEREHEQE